MKSAADGARWPKISIVTPSFNQAGYIEETIQCVLDQRYPNLEYIIMDGGSTDGSAEIIERYADRLAFWTSAPDGGQTDALAKGFAHATGDIMNWLCSDDLLAPDALFDVAETFMRNPGWQVVYGDSQWIDGKGSLIRPIKEIDFNRFVWMYDYNFLPQPSTFWRRDIYERVGGIDPRFNLAMDADLWARFAEHTALHHVPRRWSSQRYYEGQKNLRLREDSDREDALIRARYLPKESVGSRRGKRYAAKGLRVALRLARGSYW